MIETNQELAMFFALFGLTFAACFIPFVVAVIWGDIKTAKSIKRCEKRMREISEASKS